LEGVETTILDITKLEDVRKIVKEQDVKCIINCAAWTNVDKAETAGDIVETLNATAPENLAKAMKEVDGELVHISTDYVFGGDPYNTPCKEDQKGTPTGVYGMTKLHGEQKIQASGVNYLIIRTAWLYSEFGHNFVKTMLNLTASKPQLKVVFDQTGTPTYAGDLATAIFDIIENRKYEGNTGVYHYSNEGVCSWYDFTVKIAELAGNTNCDIQPCHSNEFPSPVTRPAYSVLDKTKIKETFGIHVPYWVDSLKTCMRNMNVIKA
jgi:dTDP-4-dehydrorhamnose reductase